MRRYKLRPSSPFRCFNSSPEVIRLVVLMYVRFPLSLRNVDHGFNLAMHSERLSLQHWPDRLADRLADGGWLVGGERRKPLPTSTTP